MTLWLKQSTPITLKVGPFLSQTDGVTERTALTPAVEISKNGGAFAARNSATAIIHDANGWYAVELNATDTNTLGRLQVKSDDAANHLPVWHEFMVVPANVYDSLVAGSDLLQADAREWAGVATEASDVALATAPANFAALSISAAGLVDITQAAADKVWSSTTRTLTALGASLVQEIWDRATSALTTAGSIGKLLTDNINATISSRSSHTAADVWTSGTRTLTSFGTLVSDIWSAATRTLTAFGFAVDLDAKNSKVAHNGTAQAGGATSITLASSASSTNDYYVGARVKIDSGTGEKQTRIITAYNGTTKVATVNRAWATNPDNTSVYTVYSAEAAKLDANLEVSIIQAAADKVWSSASRTLTSFGTLVADIWNNATRTLSSFGFSVTVGANNDKAGYELSANGIQAIWDRATSALTTAGSIGKLLVDNVNATISSRSTFNAAADTVTIGGIVAAAANKIADHVLRRSWASAAASSDGDTKSFRSLLGAVATLVNRIRLSGGVLTVYEADDTTALGSQNATQTAGSNPITELDTV